MDGLVAAPQPRLLEDLKMALAVLYSLQPPFQDSRHQKLPAPSSSPSSAHDFLIGMQSRNARRKIQSLQQRRRDQLNNTNSNNKTGIDLLSPEGPGSSWLACLAVLCCSNNRQAHPVSSQQHTVASSRTERLFCAQSLLHRLRACSKMVEAVDIEMEDATRNIHPDMDVHQVLHMCSVNCTPQHLVRAYKQWMQLWNPFVASVVDCYQFHAQNGDNCTTDEERKMKGELTLLTLSAVCYLTACEPTQDHLTNPLLLTLGSAMAATTVRMRYNPGNGSGSANGAQRPACVPHPMVMLITQSFEIVFKTAASHPSFPQNQTALHVALHACLASLPDTLLGNPGGARGRMSIDPLSFRAGALELRTTGLALFWETLKGHYYEEDQSHRPQGADLLILTSCERWARFLPLPMEMLQQTISLVKLHLGGGSSAEEQGAAIAYLMAIYEGGCWSVQEVLSSCFGISEQQQSQQIDKKRQSSSKKRRQKDLLSSLTTDSSLLQAQAEVQQRGEAACQTSVVAWKELSSLVRKTIQLAAGSANSLNDGGVIACMAECAKCCMPHLLKNPVSPQDRQLFLSVSSLFKEMCASPNRAVVGLCFEPLFSLHSRLIDVVRDHGLLEEDFELLVVDHLVRCSISIASSCGYPHGYFDEPGAHSDEDLEIDRNDVRELLRTVAGSEAGGSTSNIGDVAPPLAVTLKILLILLDNLSSAIESALQRQEFVAETVVHAFSSLAKPLNHLSKAGDTSEYSLKILRLALHITDMVGSMIKDAFGYNPLHLNLFSLCRTALIAVTSLAPMMSSICSSHGHGMEELHSEVFRILDTWMHISGLSMNKIPELLAPSALGYTQYDIRGAMRSPGGEDHVGCLILMRLTFESDCLARVMVNVSKSFIPELCELHQQLKTIENERGPGVCHGRGATAKSRRILLGVLCHLELLSGGRATHAMLTSVVADMASMKDQVPYSAQVLFQMCENALDIAAFSPAIVSSIFEDGSSSDEITQNCLEVLADAVIQGYQLLSSSEQPNELVLQWNRLRAAGFLLLKASANPDLPTRAAEMLQALNLAECDAVYRQCSCGAASGSAVFHEDVVSPDGIPAGLFVRVAVEAMKTGVARRAATPNCLQALFAAKDSVLLAVTHVCPDPVKGAFVDPRPALMEAWLFGMTDVINAVGQQAMDSNIAPLLLQSCVASVSILYYPTIGKNLQARRNDPGMSLDGAQSLGIADFLTGYFMLGTGPLQMAATELLDRVPIDRDGLLRWCKDDRYCGISIIGASLFRAAQGAMPPWVVESIPKVYSALFFALGKDVEAFGFLLRLSMEVRVSSQSAGFGSVHPGQLLSGCYFENMSENAKNTFISKSVDLCRKDDAQSWKRLKVLIKQACGGKKKEADFNQKPALLRWDFDRI